MNRRKIEALQKYSGYIRGLNAFSSLGWIILASISGLLTSIYLVPSSPSSVFSDVAVYTALILSILSMASLVVKPSSIVTTIVTLIVLLPAVYSMATLVTKPVDVVGESVFVLLSLLLSLGILWADIDTRFDPVVGLVSSVVSVGLISIWYLDLSLTGADMSILYLLGTGSALFSQFHLWEESLELPGEIQEISPMSWVGREIYGYTINAVLADTKTSFVLMGEREGDLYALKIPKDEEGMRELDLYLRGNFPRDILVPLVEVIRGDRRAFSSVENYFQAPPVIVTKLVSGGTVADLIRMDSLFYSDRWREIAALVIGKISEALGLLHEAGYVYVDLKPENVLLERRPLGTPRKVLETIKDSRVFLGDLGSVRRKGEIPGEISPSFTAPEVFLAYVEGKGVEERSDIFSLGVTSYLLLRRVFPFPRELGEKMLDASKRKDVETIKSIIEEMSNEVNKIDTHDELSNLVVRMLDPDPAKRPRLEEVKDTMRRTLIQLERGVDPDPQ